MNEDASNIVAIISHIFEKEICLFSKEVERNRQNCKVHTLKEKTTKVIRHNLKKVKEDE